MDQGTTAGADDTGATSVAWIVALALDPTLTMPAGEAVDRAAFVERLWERFGDDGLVGIDEGAVDVDEAWMLGLTAAPQVLDAAVAPFDRDWIAALPIAPVALWFGSEAAARATAIDLAGIAGCRVMAVHPQATDVDGRAWQHGFGPIDVPGFGLVCPPWRVPTADVAGAAGRPMVVIDPGSGFGTGLHATTQLCLAAVARGLAASSGRRVLDFGSGSGILGIAAAVLGATEVDAVEIDDRVHDAIRTNALASGVADRVRVTVGLPAAGDHDLVVANIVADVLRAEAGGLCGRVRPGGRLVLSGLVADDVAGVTTIYAALLGAAPVVTRMGEWHCLEFTRPTGT